ncbi:MAG TPA: 2-hydroxychromene-2-carboxylate isomerase [Kofleriaceae bacterium]|nr:2-hydroxychromene-2-carboxylate isomerase [Kofleriaceae bacterium]
MVLELWFDFSCPYAYLASRKAPHIARAAGVELVWKPMLLGGVFRGIGAGDGPMATLGPAKARHNLQDMHRWAELFGAPFRMPAAHPMRTVRALRTLLALPHSRWPAAIEALYAAYWQRGEDVTRDETIAGALRQSGLGDAEIAGALAAADNYKDELRARTDEAIALGIFGAPAWVIRRDGREPLLIWGQDRMHWVDAALAGWDPDASSPPGGPRPVSDGVQPFRSPSTLDVYFDVSSPFAYLGLTQLPALANVTGVTPRLQPILLGGLFRDIGQVDVPLFAMPPPKTRYTGLEMSRWARWWGVPFSMPTKFPQRTVTAQRLCVIAAEQSAAAGIRLATTLGRAMWAEQRDLEDDATLRGLLDDAGLPREWVERTKEAAVKEALIARTAAAKQAGVFGVPAWIIDEKYLFWGQDRLELVMRALGGWRPEHG